MEVIKTKVSGVTFENDDHSRQEVIRKYVKGDCELSLIREPKNPHDHNAVAVYADNWEVDTDWDPQIGYLSTEVAAQVAPKMDEGYRVDCELHQRTGGGDENYGVNIQVTITDEKVVPATPEQIEMSRHNYMPALADKPVKTKRPPKQARSSYVTNTSDKSKKTALLLCIFLGIFGAHYFYVGRIGKGLLYLFTAGLFAIGWLVDIFVILSGSFRDNVKNPLRA
jgi:restriction system protein